ncbi:MAG: 7-cyano-7-deazaguanine synthase [Candidatus Omnitrophota bacterium]|jgi:hypothetical protein
MDARICKKCVLPEFKPDIWLNQDGVCNICVDFQEHKASGKSLPPLESEFTKLLLKFRGKNKYDCLVMCSGGKDSTISLYYMKKKYHLNVLAFTFDHGFENDEALENIRNAVDILGVEWLYFKSDFMKDVFRRMIETNTSAPLCHVCAIWYLQLTYDVAARYRIPLVVAGWTKGQSTEYGELGTEYTAMSKATQVFIREYLRVLPQYKDFPLSIKEVLQISRRKFRITSVSPHWFLRYEPEEIMQTLQKELRWKAPLMSYPKDSTNCIMNFASVYQTMRHFGYTHYHVEMSKLIRKNEMTRQEALKLLAIDFDKAYCDSLLSKIGCCIAQ